MKNLLHLLVNGQHYFINILRISIFIVMAWIGGLKAFQYEADGIVPFVTNSPFMNFYTRRKLRNIKNTKILKEKW